jgi:hypothetical protein
MFLCFLLMCFLKLMPQFKLRLLWEEISVFGRLKTTRRSFQESLLYRRRNCGASQSGRKCDSEKLNSKMNVIC